MIREAGGTASFRRTDIWVAAEVEALVEHAMTTYGRRRRFRQTARGGQLRREARPAKFDKQFRAANDVDEKNVSDCQADARWWISRHGDASAID